MQCKLVRCRRRSLYTQRASALWVPWLFCSFFRICQRYQTVAASFLNQLRYALNRTWWQYHLKSMLADNSSKALTWFSFFPIIVFFENWNCQCATAAWLRDIEKIQMSWNKHMLRMLSIFRCLKIDWFYQVSAISCALLPFTSMIEQFSFWSISATSLPTSNLIFEGLHLKYNTTRDASTHR